MTAGTVVLGTAVVLFAIGGAGALLQRHPVSMLMAIEIMLNAGNLLLVFAARARGGAEGQAAALVVLLLAAAEAVVGLGLALVLFRPRPLPDVDAPAEIRG